MVCTTAFSLTFTTTALDGSSSRWFESRVWTPLPRGRPSSLVQHCIHQQTSPLDAFVAHANPANPANLNSHSDASNIARVRRPYGIFCRKDPLKINRLRALQFSATSYLHILFRYLNDFRINTIAYFAGAAYAPDVLPSSPPLLGPSDPCRPQAKAPAGMSGRRFTLRMPKCYAFDVHRSRGLA